MNVGIRFGMIPPGCLVITVIFHFPFRMRCDLESSKRNHRLLQWMGMSFQEHSHALATQQRRGFQPFLSTANSKAVGKQCLRLKLPISWDRKKNLNDFVIFQIRTLALKN